MNEPNTNGRFVLKTSPHLHSGITTQKVMLGVIIGLAPAIIASMLFFKLRAVVMMVICIATCLITEAVIQKIRGRRVTIADGSALVTGVLLALSLSPAMPLYTLVIGGFFTIFIGKQIFGGIGSNIWNPAALGRAFLAAAFPVQMTTWKSPFTDAVTSATPLGLFKYSATGAPVGTPMLDLFLGNVSGCIGETSALAFILGGLFIIWRGCADWRLPSGMLATVFVMGTITFLFGGGRYPSPFFHLFSGGLLMGALFMATDPVTTPVTKMGRWVFGIGAGFLVVLIRLWGGYPEGVMYAILIMNSVRPLLDRWTLPATFGQAKAAQ